MGRQLTMMRQVTAAGAHMKLRSRWSKSKEHLLQEKLSKDVLLE